MNLYICQGCRQQFEQTDFSDVIWSIFCDFGCLFGWCRANMPKPEPALAQKAEGGTSNVAA